MAETPQPSDEVVFGNTVEALFVKALGYRITPACRERLKACGIDLDHLASYYPREAYYACVRLLAIELFPDEDEDDAMFQLGTAFMAGFGDTLLGKAMLAAVRVMGPRRSLVKMTNNFRSSNNYLQADLRELGPGSVELTLSQTSGAPGYFAGVLTSGLNYAGARGVRVTKKEYDGVRCTYAITWDAK
jgi:uncharacterized protein (TIGR02265 family)